MQTENKIGQIRIEATAGFSAIELLVVIGVIGVLVALAAPSFTNVTDAYRLTTSADTLAAELQMARLLSISRNAQYQVTLEGNRISIADPSDPSNPRTDKFLERGVTFSVLPAQNITFFSRGNARGGKIVIQNPTGTKTIEVLAGGRVKILD